MYKSVVTRSVRRSRVVKIQIVIIIFKQNANKYHESVCKMRDFSW